MKTDFSLHFNSEADMHHWLGRAAILFQIGAICYLNGHLGAGKTSFCRGLLRGLGVAGAVKSPTYTLLEVYELEEISVCHFDLYRLADPEELLYIGAEDYNTADSLWLVEWPDKGDGFLPRPDLVIFLSKSPIVNDGLTPSVEDKGATGRYLRIATYTERGADIVAGLRQI